MPLRLKMLLIALVAAVFPLAGFRFVEQMEATLRQSQEENLVATAQTIARALLVIEPRLAATGPERLYARAIGYEMVIDGYGDDWRELGEIERIFSDREGRFQLRLTLARSRQWLYLLADVRDPSQVTPVPTDTSLARSDHVAVLVGDRTLALACDGSGPARFSGLPETQGAGLATCELGAGSYRIEARLPLSWLTTAAADRVSVPDASIEERLGVVAYDIPVRGADLPRALIGTMQGARPVQVPVLNTGVELGGLARLLAHGVRARVLGPEGRVLASSGELSAGTASNQPLNFRRWLRATVYRTLLAPPFGSPEDYRSDLQVLATPEVQRALDGESTTGWRAAGSQLSVILSAAVPLGPNGSFGALLLEQPSDALLVWTNRGLGGLILGGFVTVLVASAVLFGYAGYLSFRIRKLRTAVDNALGPEGRLQGNFPRSAARDDVGELSRAFARLLEQLREYNEYLRTLASKLSHELATPLAMVKGSIENLEHEQLPDSARTYAERARQGITRLGATLRAMSEASRIERAIDQADGEPFDLRAFVTGALAAYRDIAAARDRKLECEVPAQAVPFFGAPELLYQALDKLIDNALGFAPPGTPIRVRLALADAGGVVLAVVNQGPELPSRMQDQLFQSMVSVRDSRDQATHLGLGLYIVRLVAELHGGAALAANLPGGAGVEFQMRLQGMARLPV